MAEVKPAEVSAILKQQLSGFEAGASLDEVGTILTVGDGIARAYGLSNAQYGELVEFENGLEGIVLNLEEDNVGIVLLGPSKEIKEGSTVKRTNRIASINVGEEMVGRVVDTLGTPIDGKGPIGGDLYEMPLERKAPGVIYRQPVNEPLQTGIKSVDAMIPIGRGQRELVIGDRQTGKTTVCIDTIINQKEFYDAGEPVFWRFAFDIRDVAIEDDKWNSIISGCVYLHSLSVLHFVRNGNFVFAYDLARRHKHLARSKPNAL